MMKGYIYCLSNPSFPELLKIGTTQRTPQERADELYTSGIPTAFIIETAKEVLNPKEKERLLHKILKKERENQSREFFRVSVEKVKLLFELIDGETWGENSRNLKEICKDGQKIRHSIGDDIWIGTYDSKNNTIVCNDKLYKGNSPLNRFVMSHYQKEKPERTTANAWRECQIEKNGEWFSIY